MSNTTNYGWNIPDNTDLVKDGALAIRTLGSAIDTSMNTALGTKKAGMVLINSVTFTGVSSISAALDTFTSSFANYRVVLSMTATATGNLDCRLRATGSDDSVATYNHGVFFVSSAATSGVNAANTNLNRWIIGPLSSTVNTCTVSMDIFRPKETERTIGSWIVQGADASDYRGLFGAGVKAATTSFDSISYIFAGNSTGRLSVYGYNN
jgi:hypothetical protein